MTDETKNESNITGETAPIEAVEADTLQPKEFKDYPREVDGILWLGPEIIAAKDGSVINWKGQNYVPQPEPTDKALKDYKQGEYVEVMKQGDWMNGRITAKDSISNHLHVDTERGPITVASTKMIRPSS